jgi:hypothetical protein
MMKRLMTGIRNNSPKTGSQKAPETEERRGFNRDVEEVEYV